MVLQQRELNEREQLILQAVVHQYVTTAEPVGSRSIVRRLNLDISPATVRNVMADLTETGFLEQLHPSSGRVPTDRGYRYYVDYLMRVQELTLAERARIEQELSSRLSDIEEVMRQTTHLLALISQHTGVAEAPDDNNAYLRRIELVSVSADRVAALLADSNGTVRTVMVSLDDAFRPTDLSRLGAFLNDNLHGVPMRQLMTTLHARMRAVVDEQRLLAEQSLRLASQLPLSRPGQLFLEGASRLFEQPEFRDVDRAKEVFNLFEERDRLAELLRRGLREDAPVRTSVVIGSEAPEEGFREMSVVASPYCVRDRPVGMLGVIGPRRMPYSRLTALVEYTASMLSRLMTRLAE